MTTLAALRSEVRRTSLEAQTAAYAVQASELTLAPAPTAPAAPPVIPGDGPPVPAAESGGEAAGPDVDAVVEKQIEAGGEGAGTEPGSEVPEAPPPAEGGQPAEPLQPAEPGQPAEPQQPAEPPPGGAAAEPKPGVPAPAELDARLRELSEELARLVAAQAKKAADSQAAADSAQAALAKQLLADNADYLTKLGHRSFRDSLIALLVVSLAGLIFRLDTAGVKLMSPRDWGPELLAGRSPLAVAAAAALVLWLVLLGLSRLKHADGGLIRVLIGADGRLSTSYFQVWVWTLVLVWTFVFFVLMAALGHAAADIGGSDQDLGINADYLLLLGGPFAALVVARQVDQAKILSGDLQKSTASTTQVSDLFSTDSGRADLVDMQYLLFNVVALLFFFGCLWADPARLPDIPDALMLLTSGAALGYVARKAVQRNPPVITSIVPQAGDNAPTTGGAVIIQGSNFIPSGAEQVESIRSVMVKFDAFSVRPAPEDPTAERAAQPTLSADGMTADAIRVIVPDLSGDGQVERMVNVSVVTAPGVETPTFPLRVASPILRVRLEPVVVTDGIAQVTLTLLDSAMRARPVRITVGGVPFDTFWIDDRATVRVNRVAAASATLTAASGGATFAAQLALPA